MLDARVAQTTLENVVRDVILQALGVRWTFTSVALLRAWPTVGQSGGFIRVDDDLAVILGNPNAAYRWNSLSVAADNGTTVIKPNDIVANGRWVAWSTPLRFSPAVGGPSVTLDQITSGPLVRVMVIDRDMNDDEISSLIGGNTTPAVVIEAVDDTPENLVLAGYNWMSVYEFTITVISENLRNRREAAQGSAVPGDDPAGAAVQLGANDIDGFIIALLCSTQLNAVCDGIKDVEVGRAHNWISELGQRRVMRSRTYRVRANVSIPQAPGDTGPITDVFAQAALVQGQDPTLWPTPPVSTTPSPPPGVPAWDPANYINGGGMLVTAGAGLVQPVSAGSALIGGAVVNYAGSGGVAFAAASDTYRDLQPSGAMVFTAVPAGTAPPAVGNGNLRIGVTRTDNSGVVWDKYLGAVLMPYGSNNDIQI